MKILYGVQATGNGHISRSREVVRNLKDLGHEVDVLLSGRDPSGLWGIDMFRPFSVYRGLTFATSRGRICYLKTALNLNLFEFYRDIRCFNASAYELVVTDFEPLSSRIAKRAGLPCIGIGHQYAFLHDIPRSKANPVSRSVLRTFAPADHPIGLHWHHFGQPILPPIVPATLRNDRWTRPNKILVYLPFEEPSDFVPLLEQFVDHEFYVYAKWPNASDSGHLHLRPLSREAFLTDLAESNGVMTNAGFELVSEALYLGKRVLVKPLKNQLEQESNAMALAGLGLGTAVSRLRAEVVAQWLNGPPNRPIAYPDVARLLAEWITARKWHDVAGLAEKSWRGLSGSLDALMSNPIH
jgi:uncharacterized protein (TIGR00661 family)